jgi:thymidylate synthase
MVLMLRIVDAYNVDDALALGLAMLQEDGVLEQTRNGPALVMPCPVMTINEKPLHRVSLSPIRDANPFFHLMEALWMLAGRNDIKWLDQFVGDFSKRFGDPDGAGDVVQHGPYGFRWRNHFDVEGGGDRERLPDQLDTVVRLLKANPSDRRVVITMWDPVADLSTNFKDIPCNTHIYPRVRIERELYLGPPTLDGRKWNERQVLDLTVCCRSNDAIWGCHGANAVHFSILQEYLAARISVEVGKLYQLSNNYHAYTGEMQKLMPDIQGELYDDYDRLGSTRIVTDPDMFDDDLTTFFADNWRDGKLYVNGFFWRVAVPLRKAYALWRDGQRDEARYVVHHQMARCDWQIAAGNWFERRAMRAVGLMRE